MAGRAKEGSENGNQMAGTHASGVVLSQRETRLRRGREMEVQDNAHELQKEVLAAKILRKSLIDSFGEDEELVKDTIEGETNLHELMQAVIEDIQETNAHIDGLKDYKKQLDARKSRLEKRIDFLKTLLKTSMEAGELGKTVTFPTATLSIKNTPDKTEITEEADLPTEYWVTPDPVLSKKKLTNQLKENDKALQAYIDQRLKEEFSDLKKAEKEEKRQEIRDSLTEEDLRPYRIPGAQLKNDGPTIQIRVS